MSGERNTRRAWLAAVPLIVTLALLVGVFYPRLGAGDASRLPSPLIGRPAPPLDLPTLDGGHATDADLRTGKVTIVNVFGSWCEPCHFEHPALLALSTMPDVKDGKVVIVGMAQRDTPENVRRFLGAEGDPYGRVVLDPDNRAGIDWGVYGVPETFVVKGDGTVAYKYVGPLTEEAVRDVLAPQIRKAES
jgi:cytochrome c biogenesis protein CcmG/thiol:disulfide interchange protein DsbE